MLCQEVWFSYRTCPNTYRSSNQHQPHGTWPSLHFFLKRNSKRRATQVLCTAASNGSSEKPLTGTVIGIDLGTSNSAVAACIDGSPVIIPVDSSRPTLPSVITFGKDTKDIQVGVAAQQAASKNPLNTFSSVKRIIGRTYANCYREAGTLVYKLVEGPEGETFLWVPAREEALSPEQVSGRIMEHLISCAAKYLGTPIEGAVIAVPAHFDVSQRQATLRAAKSAGLHQVQLLQEPVAAAMAYGLHHNQEEEAILVFDLGGGTYDVSLLESFEGIFEVLSTGGDSRLGGDDWDTAIVDWCLQKCKADLRAEIRGQPELQQEMIESARLAKVQLSSATETVVHIPASRLSRNPGKSSSLTITRKDLEVITKRLRYRLGPPLERLGRECHVKWAGRMPTRGPAVRSSPKADNSLAAQQQQQEQRYTPKPRKISQVVLVGSATRIPSVRQFVTQLTGVEPCGWVNPEECVALGAAIQAGILVGGVAGMELSDGSYAIDLHDTTSGFQGLPVA